MSCPPKHHVLIFQVPKGLLALQDILDDYIILKEQKVTVDLEKKKSDILVQRIQDSLHLYRSGSDLHFPSNLPHLTPNPNNTVSPTGIYYFSS